MAMTFTTDTSVSFSGEMDDIMPQVAEYKNKGYVVVHEHVRPSGTVLIRMEKSKKRK